MALEWSPLHRPKPNLISEQKTGCNEQAHERLEENVLTLSSVALGQFTVRWGKLTGEVEVRANETAKIQLE